MAQPARWLFAVPCAALLLAGCFFRILRTPEATVAFNHPGDVVELPNPAVHGVTAVKVKRVYDAYELDTWSQQELCVRLRTGAKPEALSTVDFFVRAADSFDQLNVDDTGALLGASRLAIESSKTRPVLWREEKPVYLRDAAGKVVLQTTKDVTHLDSVTDTVARICFPAGAGVRPESQFLALRRMVGANPKRPDIALLRLTP